VIAPAGDLGGPSATPQRRRRVRLWATAAAVVVTAGLGALALSLGGEDDHTRFSSPAYAECERVGRSVAASMKKLERVAAGGGKSRYPAELDLAQRRFERLDPGELSGRCGESGKGLEEAVAKFLEASRAGR
jgi:hypothetical protein